MTRAAPRSRLVDTTRAIGISGHRVRTARYQPQPPLDRLTLAKQCLQQHDRTVLRVFAFGGEQHDRQLTRAARCDRRQRLAADRRRRRYPTRAPRTRSAAARGAAVEASPLSSSHASVAPQRRCSAVRSLPSAARRAGSRSTVELRPAQARRRNRIGGLESRSVRVATDSSAAKRPAAPESSDAASRCRGRAEQGTDRR